MTRGQGRNVVAAAAYRHRTSMYNRRDGSDFKFRADHHLVHAEMALPEQLPSWVSALSPVPARASEEIWNRVEESEKRVDGQLAREFVVALPKELSQEQNIALMRDYVKSAFTDRGMIADWVYHDNDGNPHVHVMTTLRPLSEDGFGAKKVAVLNDAGEVVRDGDKIRYTNWGGGVDDLKEWRTLWADTANRHLIEAGISVRIDHRSYEDMGLTLTGTTHLGPIANAIRLKTGQADKTLQFDAVRQKNAALIEQDPEQVLKIITAERSVFTEQDIAKTLFRFFDDPQKFQNVMAEVKALPSLAVLVDTIQDPKTGAELTKRFYSTHEMVETERKMADAARRMFVNEEYRVSGFHTEAALAKKPFLAEEQKQAVRHINSSERIAAVIGFAGSGKSTMLDAAREAWEAGGYRVIGGALAGKAAEELEKSSGIKSRTLASWELSWSKGREQLKKGDVLVIDEAGMVASRQLSRIIQEADEKGAKVILVGDAMQLQPIEAGAAFRSLCERIGYVELEGIRRQNDEWAREASIQFARGKVAEALGAYDNRGAVKFTDTAESACAAIVQDWMAARKDGTSLILAQKNKDVYAINQGVRASLMEAGELEAGQSFQTARGTREFAAGDRVLFLQNDSELGVKNGMLGTVKAIGQGKIEVDLDIGRNVMIEQQRYQHVDHGYAATIHKSQGTTVDRTFVLASRGMDQHLSYVAMSRHRKAATLYATKEDFKDFKSLAWSLGRSGKKETTLDYDWKPHDVGREQKNALNVDIRSEFLERRGYESERTIWPALQDWVDRQTERLKELWDRVEGYFAKQGIERTPEAVIAPAETVNQQAPAPVPEREDPIMFRAVLEHARSIEEVAKEESVASKAYLQEKATLQAGLAAVYCDGQAALSRIERAIAAGDDPQQLGAVLAAEPQRIGELRGSDRLLDGRQERADRKTAIEQAKAVGVYARRLGDAFRAERTTGIARETERRKRMAVSVPRLSQEASAALARIDNLRGKRDQYQLAVKNLQGTPQGREIAAFTEALRQRFGSDAFTRDHEKPDRYAHLVVEADRKILQGNQMTLRAARRLDEEERAIRGAALAQTTTITR